MNVSEERTFRDVAERAFQESWSLINLIDGWKSAKTTTLACENIDKIEWRPSSRRRYWQRRSPRDNSLSSETALSSGRIFRVTATMPGPVERVAALIRDINGQGTWNRTLQGARIVRQLDQYVLVSYQMTTSNGGFIFPRDFVLAVKFGTIDGCFVAGSSSVVFTLLPEENDLVRAWSFPGCMVVRPIPGQPNASTFQWLMELDYGGWVPSFLVNIFLPFAQVLMVDSLKKALESIEKKESNLPPEPKKFSDKEDKSKK